MTTTAFFVIGCTLCIYKLTPKNKSAIWKYAILIPLIFAVFSFIFSLPEIFEKGYLGNSFSYEVGKWIAKIIIPFVISVVFLYFYFNKKVENCGKIKVLPLILIATVAFVILMFKDVERQNRNKNNELIENKIAINEIKSSISTFKKKLPLQTADGVVIYGIKYNEEENQVEYFYQNPLISVQDLDPYDISEYKNSWRKELIKVSKNNPKNISFITAGTSMVFRLVDKYENTILVIVIKPEEMN